MPKIGNSTQSTPTGKPAKPHPDFPLFPHATKRWAKKVRGKLHYFGSWADGPDAALSKWLEVKDDLLAGRTPRVKRDGLTIAQLCNHFLTARKRKLDSGGMTAKSFDDYYRTCELLIAQVGRTRFVDDMQADDFGKLRAHIAKGRGPHSIHNHMRKINTVFKFAYDAELIDKPVRFGPEWVKPTPKDMRLARHATGLRLFEADELRRIIDKAAQPMRAMILLGINCAFGNTDVSELPQSAIDLAAGVIDYPRPKTGITRRAILWPETVEAIREAIQQRPTPHDEADNGLVFVTRFGERWVRMKQKTDSPAATTIDNVGREMGKLLHALKLKRQGLNFYALRHTFQTVAEGIPDAPAIDRIMGHEKADDMATRYRERIDDDRLLAVIDHVHDWLFAKPTIPAPGNTRKARKGKSSKVPS
ncbi:MAG: site-specific integrase [Phycisphaeraceae bacterium]